MINKLNALKRRYEELTAALSAPDAMNDQAAWREMVKEHSQLEEIVNAFDEYTAAQQAEADCKAMLEEHLDPEMKEMVHMEMAELAEKQRKLIEDMKIMLLPKDPYILLSFLNARLRDQYADLEDLCASLDADEQSLRETLAGVDYRYDPVYHQFIPITSKEV